MFRESIEVEIVGLRTPVRSKGQQTLTASNVSPRLVLAAPPHAGDDREDAGADAAADAGRGRRRRGPRAPRVRW